MEYFLPIAEVYVSIPLIFFLSLVVGILSGLFGVGGGFLMTPFLIFLGIPPAYRNVRISLNPKDKVQAIGIDSKNRKQYIYSDLYKEEQSDVKFSDLIHFGKKLKRIRKNMMKLIMSCDSIDKLLSLEYQIALIIFIIDRCNFRVGCEKYKDLYFNKKIFFI